jgi:hypothetical protein
MAWGGSGYLVLFGFFLCLAFSSERLAERVTGQSNSRGKKAEEGGESRDDRGKETVLVFSIGFLPFTLPLF